MSQITIGTLIIESLRPPNVDGTQYLVGTLARVCGFGDTLLVKPRREELHRICEHWGAGTSTNHRRLFAFLSFLISAYSLGTKHFASKILGEIKRQQNGNSELIHNIHFLGFLAFKSGFDLAEILRAERKQQQRADFDLVEQRNFVLSFTSAILALTHLPHLQQDGREVMIEGALDSFNSLFGTQVNHTAVTREEFFARYQALESTQKMAAKRHEDRLDSEMLCRELYEASGSAITNASALFSGYLEEAVKTQNTRAKPLKPIRWSA